ncbi:uncharacterized protein LOC143037449 [Oratosquilla oratoria]|uniref:uncharacterized protein LOC143037449 n=1 Tax=Oratosquilla oratoria TaxID=337810 RepID=UPI003F76AF39
MSVTLLASSWNSTPTTPTPSPSVAVLEALPTTSPSDYLGDLPSPSETTVVEVRLKPSPRSSILSCRTLKNWNNGIEKWTTTLLLIPTLLCDISSKDYSICRTYTNLSI